MNSPAPDRPNVVVFPPLILVAVLVLAILLQWLVPLGILARFDPVWRLAIGGVLMIAGLAITATGSLVLVRRGTNVNPRRPAVALATNGIYRWTRNPMYVGGGPLLIGLSIAAALDWLPLLMIPAAFALHVGVVRYEERYLEAKFGDAYRDYAARVPRYLGVGPRGCDRRA